MPFRILISPASFKGSLSACEAAEAIERGVADAARELDVRIETDIAPIADGGEGTAEILAAAVHGAQRVTTTVRGPLGAPPNTVDAEWFLVENLDPIHPLHRALGLAADVPVTLALIDSASVVGLGLIAAERRDPAGVSTRGLGELILAAGERGAEHVVLGLGGTASIDGGIGAASALGWRFDAGAGAIAEPTGLCLGEIVRITAPTEATTPAVTVLCDVTNPLNGRDGAAFVFGPQKGATGDQCRKLDKGLANLAQRVREAGLGVDPNSPGMGAAGGLAFGLAAFADAMLRPGAEVVLNALGIDRRLAEADLVLTGEGHIDSQTIQGKAVAVLAGAARVRGVPVIAIAGRADPGATGELGLASVDTLADSSTSIEDAIARAPELLAQGAARAVIAHVGGSSPPASAPPL